MSSDQTIRTAAPARLLAAAALTTIAIEHSDSAASTPCDQPGQLFLETGADLIGHGEFVTLNLAGEFGAAQFTFASGTAQADLIAAINSVVQTTGVTAQSSDINPNRVQLHSMLIGADSFVSAQQTSGTDALIHQDARRGQPVWSLIAHGEAGIEGDANCDGSVGVADLLVVIDHWGACAAGSPTCAGDLTLDGVVDVQDLLLVINNWGAGG